MKRFRVVTLGCRTNQYEAQAYQDQLLQAGYVRAEGEQAADLCIVNTCTVTESADAASRRAVRKLARQNPEAQIVVTGCSVERQPTALAELPRVTHLVANSDKEQLLEKVFPEKQFPEFSIRRFEEHTRAFVKVQDGCNSFCTYCVIPYVRGRSRSRGIDEILREVEGLVANGYREVVLTGINVGDFDGGSGENTLADLVRAVDVVPGLERLRISSIDPDEVDDNLLDAVINGMRTCPSMHIVLQAGSNVVLKRMNRKYTRQDFYRTIERLRAACDDFTFTTDVIVGFPGETELDFEETLEVIREVRFAKVHMFPYSERPRTRAALYPNKIEEQVKSARKQRVLREAERVAYALRKEYVGRRMSILTETKVDEWITGHTTNFLPVKLSAKGLEPNQILEVELLANEPEGLLARRVG